MSGNSVTPPQGRNPQTPTQEQHVIPRELFAGGNKQHPLIELFQTLPGWREAYDFENGRENLQTLPQKSSIFQDAGHSGSHPAFTDAANGALTQAEQRLVKRGHTQLS